LRWGRGRCRAALTAVCHGRRLAGTQDGAGMAAGKGYGSAVCVERGT
jgi:hypothetical protein